MSWWRLKKIESSWNRHRKLISGKKKNKIKKYCTEEGRKTCVHEKKNSTKVRKKGKQQKKEGKKERKKEEKKLEQMFRSWGAESEMAKHHKKLTTTGEATKRKSGKSWQKQNEIEGKVHEWLKRHIRSCMGQKGRQAIKKTSKKKAKRNFRSDFYALCPVCLSFLHITAVCAVVDIESKALEPVSQSLAVFFIFLFTYFFLEGCSVVSEIHSDISFLLFSSPCYVNVWLCWFFCAICCIRV